jgi:hypothetical protein
LHINVIVPNPGIIILAINLEKDSHPKSALNISKFPLTLCAISKGSNNSFFSLKILNESLINYLLYLEVIMENKIPKIPIKINVIFNENTVIILSVIFIK